MEKRKSPYGRRGRPLGFRLSEASKRAISESKRGQRHREETKDKISRSLIVYFRKQNPLSDEIINKYCRSDDDEMCDWMYDVQDELDCCLDVLTQKSMRNTRRVEVAYGKSIEDVEYKVTPEILVMFKEYCECNDLNCDEEYDKL